MDILLHGIIMAGLAAYVRGLGIFFLQMDGMTECYLAGIFSGKRFVLDIERPRGDGTAHNRSCEDDPAKSHGCLLTLGLVCCRCIETWGADMPPTCKELNGIMM